MAKGDYEGMALMNMARRAADPAADAYTKATDALRITPQLTATDLQVCIAFRLDPFSYLQAKQEMLGAISDERQSRIDSEAFRERERQQRERLDDAVRFRR